MAATDITAILKTSKTTICQPASQIFQQKYLIDVTDPALVGIETAATHNLVALPVDDVIVGGYFIVKTSFASGGAATVRFSMGTSFYFTGLLPVADLAKGVVVPLCPGLGNDLVVGNTVGWVHTTADTLDWIVGTADLTAGAGWLILETIQDVTGQ